MPFSYVVSPLDVISTGWFSGVCAAASATRQAIKQQKSSHAAIRMAEADPVE
jgi:hypothetical protein